MIGTDRHTGRRISGDAHLAQSLGDILSTPIGSLVMRRDYGSDLPDLIDAPMNGATRVDVYQAAAEAIDRWEPRLELTRVEIVTAASGRMELKLHGERDGAPAVIDVTLGLDPERAARAETVGRSV